MIGTPPPHAPGGPVQGGHRPLHFRFRGQREEVRTTLVALRRALSQQALTSAQIDRVEIVLGEALNNIVEHAFAPEPSDPWIALDMTLGRRALWCVLTDNGRAMPAWPRRWTPRPRPDTLPEGGFGWRLIRALCRRVSYRRVGGCNVLRLTIPLRPLPRASGLSVAPPGGGATR